MGGGVTALGAMERLRSFCSCRAVNSRVAGPLAGRSAARSVWRGEGRTAGRSSRSIPVEHHLVDGNHHVEH